jgi:hypothetical protein
MNPASSPRRKETAFITVTFPSWLQSGSPETKEAIANVMAQEFMRLMRLEGVRAFEMPRTAAIAHETGHAIVETVLGGRVKSVEIHSCPKLIRLGVEHAWGGVVHCHDAKPWTITRDTPAIELRHRIYRLIAGAVAEFVLDPDNVRSGSSLDERVVGQMICADLHQRERRGGHPSETWGECWDWVRAAIELNADIGRQLGEKLDALQRMKGKPLDAILRRVRCGTVS